MRDIENVIVRPNDKYEEENNLCVEMYGPEQLYLGYTQSEIVFIDWIKRVLQSRETGYYFIKTIDGNPVDIISSEADDIGFEKYIEKINPFQTYDKLLRDK